MKCYDLSIGTFWCVCVYIYIVYTHICDILSLIPSHKKKLMNKTTLFSSA